MQNEDKREVGLEFVLRIEQLVKLRYEEEVEREKSLISQASNMQTVFSVSTAALFMLLPTIIDVQYRGDLELNTVYFYVSLITFFLLLSLLLATLAQNRRKRVMFASIQSLIQEIDDKTKLKKNLENPFQFIRRLINSYHEAYNSLSQNNDERVKLIRVSMLSFYISIGICVFFYLRSVYILFR